MPQGFAAFRLALPRIQPRHSQIKRDTAFATPGYSIFDIISQKRRKSKIFLPVAIYVGKAVFMLLSGSWMSSKNAENTGTCWIFCVFLVGKF